MAAAGKIEAEVRKFVANRERRGLGTATPERILKSGGHSSVGADGTQRIVDSPFDRAHAQGRLGSGPHNERRFRAGQKYRHHWYHAGLAGNLQSPDLNRIFASDPSSNSAGMARSEAEAWHRQKYREAVQELGIIRAALVESIVCHEVTFETAGMQLGYDSRARGIDRVTAMLCGGLDKLAKLWGID